MSFLRPICFVLLSLVVLIVAVHSSIILKGKVYVRMELCRWPRVSLPLLLLLDIGSRTGNSTAAPTTTSSSTLSIPSTSHDEGPFNAISSSPSSSTAALPSIIPSFSPISSDSASDGIFQLEVPDALLSSGPILKLEAECVSPDEQTVILPRVSYSLNLTQIDWNGAHHLLLFNDVSLLAFGYGN